MSNLPDIGEVGWSLCVIDDQTTEVAMFAALKLGDMIREAIKNDEALAKQDGPEKAGTGAKIGPPSA